jgi:peptidylprolyl isomerase
MRPLLILAAIGTLGLAACSRGARELPAPIPALRGEVRTAFTLRYTDVAAGTGASVQPRKCIYAHYTGWLTNGTKFDSSRDTTSAGAPRPPIAFPQGARRVIAGWDAGFEGMRVGSRRRLFIPYQLAYGELGRPPVIPPKAELIFDVEVMAVADTLPRTTPVSPGPVPPVPGCASWTDVSRAAPTG